MTDPVLPDDLTPGDRDDLIAAEYVLGVLPGAERRAAAQRAEVDGDFAARIAAWEGRLAPLNAGYADGPVPDVLPQVEAVLFPAPPRRRVWAWGLGSALAAGLALAVILWPQPPVPLVARLAAGDVAFEARFDGAVLQIAHSGPLADAGHDYQLWAIGADGVPRSLGLLRGDTVQVAAVLEPGVTLAVSLEPLGGAPGVVPTGAVLAAAVLE